MRIYKCPSCRFAIPEADKAWDEAVSSGLCPKCGGSLVDFPIPIASAQESRTPSAASATTNRQKPRAGRSSVSPKFCPRCGHKAMHSGKFCTECGMSFVDGSVARGVSQRGVISESANGPSRLRESVWGARKWNIYRHNSGRIEAVEQGFNWFAFFFGGIWALFKGLLWAGIIGLAVNGVAARMPTDANVFAVPLIFGLMLIYGFLGNSWVCASLERRGYACVTQVMATRAEHAKQIYRNMV